MPLSLITAPVGQAMDLAVVKLQCRVDADFTDEDDYFADVLIPMAADRAEIDTRRALLGPQTWDYVLDEFPREGYLEIPKPPLVGVTFVRYVDTGGVTQTMTVGTQYLVQAPAGPRCKRGRIALPFATIWPITLRQMGAVTVRFVAGYGDASTLPPLLRMGMLLDTGTLYENRESILTGAREQAIPLPTGTQDIYDRFRSYPSQRLRGVAS